MITWFFLFYIMDVNYKFLKTSILIIQLVIQFHIIVKILSLLKYIHFQNLKYVFGKNNIIFGKTNI